MQGAPAVSAEEWVELANGCLCCSVKTEFVSALEGLLRRKSGFDYILIETTGAHSCPWPIMDMGNSLSASSICCPVLCRVDDERSSITCCSRANPESTARLESLLPAPLQQMRATSPAQHAGLADPGPVAAALWTDKELEAGVTLDAVVTVVDALRVDRQLAAAPAVSAANEAEQQIAHADVVLLNKVRKARQTIC